MENVSIKQKLLLYEKLKYHSIIDVVLAYYKVFEVRKNTNHTIDSVRNITSHAVNANTTFGSVLKFVAFHTPDRQNTTNGVSSSTLPQLIKRSPLRE